MEKLVEMAKLALMHGPEIIGTVSGLLTALIAVFVLIPGPEPEATLQKIVDFIAKFSAKPAPAPVPVPKKKKK